YKDPVDRVERGPDGLLHGIGDRTYSGFRDLILGAKYKLYHGSAMQLSAIAYVIAPTGKPEDPRDLFDVQLGDGQWDGALLAAITMPLGDFRFAASTGYEISFGDTINKRLTTISWSQEVENDLAQGKVTEQELLDKRLDDASLIPV